MNILLSWQLVVALILFLVGFASSELESYDYSIDPTPTEAPDDKPLPTKFSSMQYSSVCVNIYNSETTSNNKKIYFYSPIALLKHTSIVFNETANQGLINFNFLIWNQDLNIKVAQHLTRVLNEQVEPNQVQVFPFDSVRLTSNAQSSGDFSLTNEWVPYKNEASLRLSVTCQTYENCNQVKTQMRGNPKEFEHLQLFFNPQLNEDNCFYDGVEISQENEFSIQIEELKKRLEETKLNFIKQQTTTAENFETKRNELEQMKATVEELSTKLNGTKQELVETKTELEENRADLSKIVVDLSTKLNATEKEFSDMKNIAGNLSSVLEETKQQLEETRANLFKNVIDLSTDLNAKSQRFGHELKVTEDHLRKELRTNLNRLETAIQNMAGMDFASTRTELSSTKSVVADLVTKLNARTSEIVDIGQMPTSCSDLQQMGHKLSGFFSVKGSKKMEMIYCNFFPNQNKLQNWIGYADVKSTPVYFYAQRNSPFTKNNTLIPFDLARMNEGNALSLTSGIFTAPRPGIYFFSFTGMAHFPASSSPSYVYLRVGMYLNGSKVGYGNVQEANTVDEQHSPFTFQTTLKMKSGDKVWVQIEWMSSGAWLHDTHYQSHFSRYTHFIGFMLEEEIANLL